MRTLSEILTAVKQGERPEYDELRYALRLMEALSTMDNTGWRRDAGGGMRYKESFGRWKRALAADPKVYLGHTYDPDNPEAQDRHRWSVALIEAIAEKIG